MPVKDTEAKGLSPSKLKKTQTGITALLQIEGYDPKRAEFAFAKATIVKKTMDDANAAEIAAMNALEKARDAAAKAQWAAYNFMQGATEQVVGQYGSSSDEYASLGYKKKTEYKKTPPGRGKKSAGGGNA